MSTKSSSPSPTRRRAPNGSRSSCPLPEPRAACSRFSRPAAPIMRTCAASRRTGTGSHFQRTTWRRSRPSPRASCRSIVTPRPSGRPSKSTSSRPRRRSGTPAGVCRVHVTVSPGHRAAFEAVLEQARPRLERETGARFEVRFSEQAPSTDTVAIDESGRLFRDSEGRLLFPAGRARRSPEEPLRSREATSSS